MMNKNDILDTRKIKKNGLFDLYEIPSLRKHLCNGIVTTEVTNYLGYFKKSTKKNK